MEITFLKRDNGEFGEEISPLLQEGSIHYVSVAMPGLTVACANLPVDSTLLNATIYDGHNRHSLPEIISLFFPPLPQVDSSIYNDGDYSEEEVIAHILDAFKANSEYIQSDTMYFDFRNLSVSEKHYVSSLKKALDHLDRDDLPTQVITWGPRTL